MSMQVEFVSLPEAREFLLIPEIWEVSADDDCSPEFEIPDSVLALGGRLDDGTLAGLSLLHPYRDGSQFHFYMLRRYRRQWARPLVASIIGTCVWCNLTPLYALIPATYRSIVNFAEHAGFRPVGVEPGVEAREVLKWAS